MTARYLLCPGPVRSRTDGQWHHVGAGRLAELYGVRLSDCLVLPEFDGLNPGGERSRRHDDLRARAQRGELIKLGPRSNGDYSLPGAAR